MGRNVEDASDLKMSALVFRCGPHKLRIPAREVVCVLPWKLATSLPIREDGFRGTIGYAGIAVPIVDIAASGGEPAQPTSAKSVVAVLDVDGSLCGLLASSVLTVY